ncbi:MAG TPA: multifunctional CCA addition/repair protein [Burkholderiales bacterium]|nr:multifunctional CCA addition/repair protein [Burkholderiales bacterium]
MRVYAVGGAVRDGLLGLPVEDRDYVVVGATPEDMVRLGFKPVGRDFPVFLHPVTREEYALARTERKKGRGYKGFEIHASPEVTLEQDLARRDLTINAIARDEQGRLIDPFHGAQDLQAGILRHVGPAFVEDPVRVLRVARFAARFGFRIAEETLRLMRAMVENGEVDQLVPERVWQELSKGLMEARPSRMFEALRACGALARVLPELDALFGVAQQPETHPEIDTGVHVMMVIDYAAQRGYPLTVRYAALAHDLGKGATPREILPRHQGHEEKSVAAAERMSERLRAPAECRDLALLAARYHGEIHRAEELPPASVLSLLSAVDALRRPQRFEELLAVCECDFRGRSGFETRAYSQADILRAAAAAARGVDAGAIAACTEDAASIARNVEAARLDAVAQALARVAAMPEPGKRLRD